jgi:predicted metal-dependent hydrolase
MEMNFVVRKSKRARRVRIAVHGDGDVVVSGPLRMSDAYAAKAVETHRAWIEKMVEKCRKMSVGLMLEKETVDKRRFLHEVVELVKQRAADMSVRARKVGVRKMRSRWGSCSREGNISINLLLGHLEPRLLEYVVIHELAHIAHHNHSKAFWSLVESYLLDYRARRKLLKRYGFVLRK